MTTPLATTPTELGLSATGFPAASASENAALHQRITEQALKTQRNQLMLELAMHHPFFKKLMAIIEAKHIEPDFTPAQLAQSQNLSRSQLQRKVAALTERTVIQIIRDCRLAHAQRLLKDPALTISEIAYRSGFQDPSYFTRLFTREMDCPPSEWRTRVGN